jgi:DNA-binding transcriptional ArsR family regulator
MQEKELERIFKAFANKRRIAVIRFLRDKGPSSVGDIANAIKLSFTATSKHLLILSAADIIEKEQVSLTVFYSLPKNHTGPISKIVSAL